jgi:hypothetical protein
MDKGDTEDPQALEKNRKLKRAVLDAMFTHCDTFYIHCMPHPDLVIGKRGLADREQEEGIVLVFGPYSARQLSWDERFLHCELQFSRWERIAIPYECIARLFDKAGQVIMQWSTPKRETVEARRTEKTRKPEAAGEASAETDAPQRKEKDDAPRVIEVDFRKRKKEETPDE